MGSQFSSQLSRLPRRLPAGTRLVIEGRDGRIHLRSLEFPDGRVEPLVWLDDYKEKYAHPFLFRTPLELPAGTVISGIPPGATVLLLPEEKAEEKE